MTRADPWQGRLSETPRSGAQTPAGFSKDKSDDALTTL